MEALIRVCGCTSESSLDAYDILLLSFFMLRLRLLCCIYNKRKNLQREGEEKRERCYSLFTKGCYSCFTKVNSSRERERTRATERENARWYSFSTKVKVSHTQVLLSVLVRVNCCSQSYGLAKSLSWNYSMSPFWDFFFFFFFTFVATKTKKNKQTNKQKKCSLRKSITIIIRAKQSGSKAAACEARL